MILIKPKVRYSIKNPDCHYLIDGIVAKCRLRDIYVIIVFKTIIEISENLNTILITQNNI